MRTGDESIDVVIVGAGPNGLMLACELALAGVTPLVLERDLAPSEEPRANGLVGQVVTMLDRRGLARRLDGSGAPQPIPGYEFGALLLDFGVLEHNPMRFLPVSQQRIVRVLEERAAELGVPVRRGHEVVAFDQDDDAVTLEVAGPDGNHRLRTRYLVGADGAHSVVRKLAGIGFPGVTADRRTSRAAHVTLPREWIDGSTGALEVPGYGSIAQFVLHRTERGTFSFTASEDQPDVVAVVEWDQPGPGDDEPLTFDELRAGIRRVLGVDVPFDPPAGAGPHVLRRRTGCNIRIADRFRAGRVLLIGDAAHVHSAVGGPGLNLGMQDAMNLGWKLAAEVGGRAPLGLLDSYGAERRPVAERVVMQTQAQSALSAPGPEVTALLRLFGEFLEDPANVARLAGLLAGTDTHYDMGAHRPHPLIGRCAPDITVHTGTRSVPLAELTATARPLLLDLSGDESVAAALAGWRDRLDVVSGRPVEHAPAVLLLRPDCYVAWACADRPDAGELADLGETIRRWFGEPVRS